MYLYEGRNLGDLEPYGTELSLSSFGLGILFLTILGPLFLELGAVPLSRVVHLISH